MEFPHFQIQNAIPPTLISIKLSEHIFPVSSKTFNTHWWWWLWEQVIRSVYEYVFIQTICYNQGHFILFYDDVILTLFSVDELFSPFFIKSSNITLLDHMENISFSLSFPTAFVCDVVPPWDLTFFHVIFMVVLIVIWFNPWEMWEILNTREFRF